MSVFFWKKGRRNTKAWGELLAQAGALPKDNPGSADYAAITDALIEEDCRSIVQCARTLLQTRDADLRSRSRLTMYSHYNRLLKLEPYADKAQQNTIRTAKEVVANARKYR